MYVEKHVLSHGSHRQTPPDVFEQEQSTGEASTLHPFQFAQLLGLVLAAAEFLGPGFVAIMTIMLLPWFAPPMEKKSLYSLPHYKTVTQSTLKHQTSEQGEMLDQGGTSTRCKSWRLPLSSMTTILQSAETSSEKGI